MRLAHSPWTTRLRGHGLAQKRCRMRVAHTAHNAHCDWHIHDHEEEAAEEEAPGRATSWTGRLIHTSAGGAAA